MSVLIATLVFAAAVALPQDASNAGERTAAEDFVAQVVSAEATGRGVPGVSVAVVLNGQAVVVRGYGMADLEARREVTAATPFNIASVTKPFTALVVCRLATEHKLDLDAEAGRYAAWLPDRFSLITVRQLLTHTSGIVRDVRRDNRDDPEAEEYRARLSEAEPSAAPGVRWEYSNTGYAVLGWVAEGASGQSLEALYRREIFEPAGMLHASYRIPVAADPERARPYQLIEGRPQPIVAISGGFGSGGLAMSASDFAAFAVAIQGGELMSASDLERAGTPGRLGDGSQAVPGVYSKDDGYGFGWFVTSRDGHRMLAHGGGIDGFSASLEHFPDDRLTIAVLANSKARDDGAAPVVSIAKELSGYFLDPSHVVHSGAPAAGPEPAGGAEGQAAPPGADLERVRKVVEDYLRGLKFNDVRCFERAFWPDASLFNVDREGRLAQLTQAEWYRSFEGIAGREEEGTLGVDTIDITGDAASVKVTEEYPTSIYTDYLNLLRIDGEWRIVNKIYTSRAR